MARYLAPLVVFVVIAAFFAVALLSRLNPNDVPSALVGKPVPTFSLPSVTDPNEVVSNETLAGKVSLVNVWGTWCVECRHEHAFLVELGKWKLDPALVGEIRCPTLVTAAESDMASSNAKELYDALKCPKAMIRFSDSDGAGMHCEALNRSMANRQIFNWLDETMASRR